MLDPAILCPSPRFVPIAPADVTQPRRFLTSEYYITGAKVGLPHLIRGDMPTGKPS